MSQEQFDVEAIYDEQIFPLMGKILEICKEHRMPMMATFLYRVSGEGDDQEQCFCTSVLNERMGQRHSEEISRAADIIRNGIPENRVMTFRITKADPGDTRPSDGGGEGD